MNYGRFSIAAAVDSPETITRNNFEVIFDGEKWIAKWDWKNEPLLRSRTDFYKMDKAVYPRFKSEVERWIENGWLVKTRDVEAEAEAGSGSGLFLWKRKRKRKREKIYRFRFHIGYLT